MNRDFDDEEQKAIDKIDLGDGAKTLSFKEYQMQKIEEQMQEEETKKKEVVVAKPKKKPMFKKKAKSTLDDIKKVTAKASKIEKEEVEDHSALQQTTDIHMKVDLKSLIKNAVKHNKKDKKVEEPAPEPVPVVEAPVETPVEKKLSDQTQEKIQQKLNKELSAQGEKLPSDITQALADSTEGDSNEEPSGFVGKYLKKHRDAK